MNKKYWIIGIIAAAVLITVGAGVAGVGYVYAQSTPAPGTGFGRMMRGANFAGDEGPLHDYMIAAFAEKLSIPAADLQARVDKGETIMQIAATKDMTVAQFQTMMTDARTQAIAQALKDGKITQAQADWMKQGGPGMMGQGRGMGGRGFGQGQGMRGGRGLGQNGNANPNSPIVTATPTAP